MHDHSIFFLVYYSFYYTLECYVLVCFQAKLTNIKNRPFPCEVSVSVLNKMKRSIRSLST